MVARIERAPIASWISLGTCRSPAVATALHCLKLPNVPSVALYVVESTLNHGFESYLRSQSNHPHKYCTFLTFSPNCPYDCPKPALKDSLGLLAGRTDLMTFTVFRRHNRDNCDSTNRYEPRCGCPLWVQFVWKGSLGQFEGKKLTYCRCIGRV
jgi:hypothetical protein